jgi:hypothetical protein
MTQISRFTEEVVLVAERVTGDGDESAAPNGGGGFADYALVSLHCLRIYLDTSYRMTIDLLNTPSAVGHQSVNLLIIASATR